ncbi:MAG: hypothetical protein ACN6PN_19625, partial [Sphingobacterium sp.]
MINKVFLQTPEKINEEPTSLYYAFLVRSWEEWYFCVFGNLTDHILPCLNGVVEELRFVWFP